MRHKSREYALQALYQAEINNSHELSLIDDFLTQIDTSAEITSFSRELILGTFEHWDAVTERVSRNMHNWKLGRLPVLVRNILRLATYEMCLMAVPHTVVMDEAIELARDFIDDASAAFINSVLQKIYEDYRSATASDEPEATV
ncbi:MAG: transcription antitermination factor NusB [SAR324 cluster bacterium]|nr:transcription antitermination factor NusB [SAR324 cluster bacterium]